ncbi:hypothetical protein ROZALSC1DRAFT_27727, partial [Rozella allomycis CSF55]
TTQEQHQSNIDKMVFSRAHFKCMANVEAAIKNDPGITYLVQAINAAGCKFSLKQIVCTDEIGNKFGGAMKRVFPEENEPKPMIPDMSKDKILINQDYAGIVDEGITIRHELIHAFDHCRIKDLNENDCYKIACTEVRAANLSGECKFTKEFMGATKYSLSFLGRKVSCVRRNAIKSLMGLPQCALKAHEFVDAVLTSCYLDTAPLPSVFDYPTPETSSE